MYALGFNYKKPDSLKFLNAFIADEIWNTLSVVLFKLGFKYGLKLRKCTYMCDSMCSVTLLWVVQERKF